MIEPTPVQFLLRSVLGGLTGAIGMAALSIYYVAVSFVRRARWKDDATLFGKAKTIARYVYYESNWSAFPRIVAAGFGGGFAIVAVAQILIAGVYLIFVA